MSSAEFLLAEGGVISFLDGPEKFWGSRNGFSATALLRDDLRKTMKTRMIDNCIHSGINKESPPLDRI